jgi:hypothetical protein
MPQAWYHNRHTSGSASSEDRVVEFGGDAVLVAPSTHNEHRRGRGGCRAVMGDGTGVAFHVEVVVRPVHRVKKCKSNDCEGEGQQFG